MTTATSPDWFMPAPVALEGPSQPPAPGEGSAERPAGIWPFAGPSVLAPMEGVSHAEFRALMAEMGGLHLVCTEFVRVTQTPLGRSQVRRNVQKAPGVPLSVQVMGNDEQRMAEAAALVEAAGADVVDINLGCPMPRIVRKGVGAAMLKDPALLARVLGMMRASTRGLLSAKIRAGFDTSSEVLDIADLVQRSGVDFITVHPRRRCDFYSGVADWRIIATLKRHLSIPVVGNGDVWYAVDAERMQRETGCDAVMIGRPCLRNPWIFRQIDELRRGVPPYHPSGADVCAHLEAVITRYRRVFVERRDFLGPLKEMVTWMGRALPDAQTRLRGLLRLGSEAEVLAACERLFAPLGPQELDLDAAGSLRLERSGSALLLDGVETVGPRICAPPISGAKGSFAQTPPLVAPSSHGTSVKFKAESPALQPTAGALP